MNEALKDLLKRRASDHRLRRAAQITALEERDEEPGPGDVYALADLPAGVEWVVLEAAVLTRSVRGTAAVVAIPADGNPLAGVGDVEVAPAAPGGPLTLRCGLAVEIPASRLSATRRRAVLSAEVVKAARRRWQEISGGTHKPLPRALEAEADPELLDWRRDVLAVACDPFLRAVPHLEAQGVERPQKLWIDGARGLVEQAGRALGTPLGLGEVFGRVLEAAQAAAFGRRPEGDRGVAQLYRQAEMAWGASFLGLPEGMVATDLARAGWGLVVPPGLDPAVLDALQPLIEHRRVEAGERLRILRLGQGEEWRDFLARHGASSARVDPSKVPYYLLLVGSPAELPFEIERALGVEYAVGRLSFSTFDAYRRYAESLVAAETTAQRGGRVAIFAPRHPDDPVSAAGAELARRLAARLDAQAPEPTHRLLADAATRDALRHLLEESSEAPSLLVAVAHGLGLTSGDPNQDAYQGALVTQEWPGLGPADADALFAASDLDAAARVHGSVVWLSAAWSAATPARDVAPPDEEGARLAPEPLVSGLARGLLTHPGGGATAVVGRRDRLWSAGPIWPAEQGEEDDPVARAITAVAAGQPVGHAVQELSRSAAVPAERRRKKLDAARFGARLDDAEIANFWMEQQRREGWMVLGDPAARVRNP